LSGSDQQDERPQADPRKLPEFDTWVLHLPPINLYNVELIYLAFGYDMRYDLKENRYEYDEERF